MSLTSSTKDRVRLFMIECLDAKILAMQVSKEFAKDGDFFVELMKLREKLRSWRREAKEERTYESR